MMLYLKDKPTVCIQGLGFVGSAMAILIASTKNKNSASFNVYGLEQSTKRGKNLIKTLYPKSLLGYIH